MNESQQAPATVPPARDSGGSDDNPIVAERRAKLAALRAAGIAFPNDARPADRAGSLFAAHDGKSREQLQQEAIPVAIAGRMMLKRVQGKASFATIQDMTGRIQLCINDEGLGAETHDAFKHGTSATSSAPRARCSGRKTGELSVQVHARCGCSPSRCGRCRRSSTAWPTRRSATASATST